MMSETELQDDSIRLLNVSGGSGEEWISCRTHVVKLGSKPQYAAVSYTWGDDTVVGAIAVDEEYLHVRKNLLELLKYLRLAFVGQNIWIDALCIDQKNVQQRNHQVGMMGQIFASSSHVILWLGVEADMSHLAMQLLQQYSVNDSAEHRQKDKDVLEPLRYEDPNLSTSEIVHSTQELVSLKKLCDRAYWSRTWIVQELIYGTDIQIHCGGMVAAWHALTGILTGPCRDIAVFHMLRKSIFYQIVDHKSSSTGLNLEQLLIKYQTSKCQDPRDKIYAMFNLANDREELQYLRPDYSKSVHRLLSDVLLCIDPAKRDTFRSMLGYMLGISSPDERPFPTEPRSEHRLFSGEGPLRRYAGKLKGFEAPMALRILIEPKLQTVSLEVLSVNGEMIWLAFLGQLSTEQSWQFRQSESDPNTIYASGSMFRTVSLQDQAPKVASDGRLLEFLTIADAEDFLDTLENLR